MIVFQLIKSQRIDSDQWSVIFVQCLSTFVNCVKEVIHGSSSKISSFVPAVSKTVFSE